MLCLVKWTPNMNTSHTCWTRSAIIKTLPRAEIEHHLWRYFSICKKFNYIRSRNYGLYRNRKLCDVLCHMFAKAKILSRIFHPYFKYNSCKCLACVFCASRPKRYIRQCQIKMNKTIKKRRQRWTHMFKSLLYTVCCNAIQYTFV